MKIMSVIINTMESKKISQKQLCNYIGVCESKFSDWKKGRIKSYNKYLPRIAEFLGVTVDYLVNGGDGYAFSSLERKSVPLLGSIHCGPLGEAVEIFDGYYDLSDNVDADFCLKANGDSMINARIFDGDIVFIKQQPDVENGEIAAVIVDGEATLKRVYKYDGRIELRPENPLYSPMNFEKQQLQNVRIMGKAVSFISNVI